MSDTTKQTDVPKDLGVEIGGSGRAYFDNVVLDNMLDALVEMSAALWTVRDRQIVLEKVLEEKGHSVSALIESHVPHEAELKQRHAERDALAERIFRSFVRRPTAEAAKTADEPSLREIED